jgi:hypothetical protein
MAACPCSPNASHMPIFTKYRPHIHTPQMPAMYSYPPSTYRMFMFPKCRPQSPSAPNGGREITGAKWGRRFHGRQMEGVISWAPNGVRENWPSPFSPNGARGDWLSHGSQMGKLSLMVPKWGSWGRLSHGLQMRVAKIPTPNGSPRRRPYRNSSDAVPRNPLRVGGRGLGRRSGWGCRVGSGSMRWLSTACASLSRNVPNRLRGRQLDIKTGRECL